MDAETNPRRARMSPPYSLRAPVALEHPERDLVNTLPNEIRSTPDRDGRFGPYGGRYVPETLMSALDELEREYRAARADAEFHRELDALYADFVGRPSPLYFAKRMTQFAGGARI